MISSLKLSIILIFTFGLVKFSVSLMPAKFIQGSQPKTKTLHDTGFQTPLALHTRRSQSSTTAVYASSDDDDIASMRAGAIKKELESYGISTVAFVEKSELVQALTKARADGLKPKEPASTSSNNKSTEPPRKKKKRRESSTTSSSDESEDSRPREERLAEELEKCKAMKVGDLKKELEGIGISTKSFFEKTDFVKALADARVDGVGKEKEGYAEYTNVEVLTDDASGPRPKNDNKNQQQAQGGGNPFGGASPFGDMGGMGGMGDMGGMGGMGGIADMLKNMGGMGGMGGQGGASPFGGANPFGGGMGGDAMGKAQELMKNPKVMELMMKAQGNPKIMAAMQECMSNPAAFAKYQNDPEVSELIKELQKVM